MRKPKTVSIIGFGRFGQLLGSILKPDFVVKVHDRNVNLKSQAEHLGLIFKNLEESLGSEVIFYCVPISQFESVIRDHIEILKNSTETKTLIDVLSVKIHPKQILERYLPATCESLLTHPMFGPDGVQTMGLSGQTIVMDQFRLSDRNFKFWKSYFEGKGLNVMELSADEHDRMAARSQGVTHLIGRVLHEFGFAPTPIDTMNAKRLFEIETQVINDSFNLFADLQTFNPYAEPMRAEVAGALDNICKKLNNIAQQTMVK